MLLLIDEVGLDKQSDIKTNNYLQGMESWG